MKITIETTKQNLPQALKAYGIAKNNTDCACVIMIIDGLPAKGHIKKR